MIAVKKKIFAFADLRGIEVDNGVLRLYTYDNSGSLLQKGSAYVPLSEIANFDVLPHPLGGADSRKLSGATRRTGNGISFY